MRLLGIEFSDVLLHLHPKGQRPREFWRLQNPLPQDAEYVWCFMRPDQRSVVFVYTHPSFPEVPVGARIPIHDLLLTGRVIEEVDA